MTTISAQIIADSITPTGKRLTTMQLRYPRFIHAEFMTHRAFSRNASSSRAIPVERMIEDILSDTAMPIHWGKNQPGMQARDECSELVLVPDHPDTFFNVQVSREAAWNRARDEAIRIARGFHEAGYHKQIVNRLLEPFMHINVLVTATEWDNFFALRDHPDAEPHIAMLARAMKDALHHSMATPLQPGEWHLPYVTDEEGSIEDQIKISVARCARVSYLTHDGRKSTVEEDLALYDRLVGSAPIHASPAEHQATPDKSFTVTGNDTWYENYHLHGNFSGWIQYRKTLPNENITGL